MRLQRIAQPGDAFVIRSDGTGAGYDPGGFMAVMAGTDVPGKNDGRHTAPYSVRKSHYSAAVMAFLV